MKVIVFVIVFYFLMWPFYFRIAMASFKYYLVNCKPSEYTIEIFTSNLHFPFSLLNNSVNDQGLTGTNIPTVLKQIDDIKSSNINQRYEVIINSIGPVVILLIFIFLLFRAYDLESLLMECLLIALISVTLMLTWRFGHQLCETKSPHD